MMRRRIQNDRSRKRARRGAVFLEFVVAFPILFFATLAIFEFTMAMIVVDTATTAVVQGAREGAYGFPSTLNFDDNAALDTDPTVDDDIADAIALVMDEYLAVHNLEIRQDGVNDDLTKPNAYVRIVRETTTAERGDLDLAAACTQAGAAPVAGEIVITLCFPLVDAANPTGVGNPVPDWLSSVGFSLATYRFEATSRALLE
jgi:hypothetical protein